MRPDRALELRILMEHEARMAMSPKELFGGTEHYLVDKTCRHCGKTFVASKRYAGKKIYCSSDCHDRATRHYARRESSKGICGQCGAEMTMNRIGSPKKYCSRLCKLRALRSRQEAA